LRMFKALIGEAKKHLIAPLGHHKKGLET